MEITRVYRDSIGYIMVYYSAVWFLKECKAGKPSIVRHQNIKTCISCLRFQGCVTKGSERRT